MNKKNNFAVYKVRQKYMHNSEKETLRYCNTRLIQTSED